MKLKTKFQDEDFELGEVVDVAIATNADGSFTLRANADKGGLNTFYYKSLNTLNEMWEDYEEPKLFYRITCEGVVVPEQVNSPQQFINDLKRIGNYFETKEEAEKAVEKLKAITRLKNKGAEFYGWHRNQTGTYELFMRWEDVPPRSYEVAEDLDLIFGGEE